MNNIDTYLQFVHDRHEIWVRRQAGVHQNFWTDDPILASRKFTNVFRVLDHGTQFVLTDLIYGNFHDTLMRCFLYRYTNRPDPWQHFKRVTGAYPTVADLSGRLQTVWGTYSARGNPIFGNAYKMFVGKENAGSTRLEWALELARREITELFAQQIQTQGMRRRHEMLTRIPRCGKFMAMQINTDIGYSSWIRADEDEFVIAGPGAKIGASHVMPDRSPQEVIDVMHREFQHDDVGLWMNIDTLRTPSKMDIQNTLCEFGKYMRWRDLPQPKRSYRTQHEAIPPTYPNHWKQDHAQSHLPNSI